MVRIITGSRLHFGLFSLPVRGVSHWSNAEGQPTLPARHFGGVGLMVDQPGVEITVQRARDWSARGPSAERALQFAQRFIAPHSDFGGGFEISVVRCSSEHAGLGTGTQLALAVGRALAMAMGHDDWDAVELARRVGRGLRSSVGIHGFQHGGLLVEGGKTNDTTVAPLLVRHAFPDEWHVLLVVSRDLPRTHGLLEREAFARLEQQEPNHRGVEALCQVMLLGLLPALVERDLVTFGEALYDYNRRAGEMFAPCQGGVYSRPQTEELIRWLRQQGLRGVGQSSWGPAVFAIDHPDVLHRLRDRLLERGALQPDDVIICRAANHGARVE